MTPENTYTYPYAYGYYKACRICRRNQNRASNDRNRLRKLFREEVREKPIELISKLQKLVTKRPITRTKRKPGRPYVYDESKLAEYCSDLLDNISGPSKDLSDKELYRRIRRLIGIPGQKEEGEDT